MVQKGVAGVAKWVVLQKWGGAAKMGWCCKNGVVLQKWGGAAKMGGAAKVGWCCKSGVVLQDRDTRTQKAKPSLSP